VPIKDASNEGREEERLRVTGRDRLGNREGERHVAIDALGLQPGRGLQAFPGRRELDQNVLLIDAPFLVEGDERLRFGDHGLGVERKIRVDLGRHAARNDLRKFGSEVHGDAVGHFADGSLLFAPPGDRLVNKTRVGRHLCSLQDQRRICRGVGRLVGADRLHVASVRDDRGHRTQLIKLTGHGRASFGKLFYLKQGSCCPDCRASARHTQAPSRSGAGTHAFEPFLVKIASSPRSAPCRPRTTSKTCSPRLSRIFISPSRSCALGPATALRQRSSHPTTLSVLEAQRTPLDDRRFSGFRGCDSSDQRHQRPRHAAVRDDQRIPS
jgi:hypothetical protein